MAGWLDKVDGSGLWMLRVSGSHQQIGPGEISRSIRSDGYTQTLLPITGIDQWIVACFVLTCALRFRHTLIIVKDSTPSSPRFNSDLLLSFQTFL